MLDQLDEFLGSRCSLTKTQVDRLVMQISREREVVPEEGLERKYVISGVSEGAYYRVVSQAKKNVEESLYTMLLCSRMGILRSEDLVRLLNLIEKIPSGASENTDEVISLIDALTKKIVML